MDFLQLRGQDVNTVHVFLVTVKQGKRQMRKILLAVLATVPTVGALSRSHSMAGES